MKHLRITLVLPFPIKKPVGGAKNMYEYANRLSARGHRVTILHSTKRPFHKSKSLRPSWLRAMTNQLKGISRPKWFSLHPSVVAKTVPSITDRYVPDGDIVLSTWWQMTYAIAELSPRKGKAFNIIQDYEIWEGQEEKVQASYRLPVTHMVIASYLEEIVLKNGGRRPLFVPSAVDTERFQFITPLKDRNPASIMMLFSTEPRKATANGIEAILPLREKFPSLKFTLFGVYDKPELPEWVEYHQMPSNLHDLYNEHTIFFSPSLREGWALPPAEAMSSGCALACTAIGGHAYAIEGETALTFEPKDIEGMREKLELLLGNDQLREKIAMNGYRYITTKFSWDHAVDKLEEYFSVSLGEPILKGHTFAE